MKSIILGTQGILRTEVRLIKSKAIREYTDAVGVLEQIIALSKSRQEIFLNVFTQVISFGDYYKKNKVVEIIQRDIKDSIMRRKMLRLLALIPGKKSLYLAQKSMKCRNIEKVMDDFAKINVAPVTISKRHDAKYMKNIYNYLSD